jgi:hypothetical protein
MAKHTSFGADFQRLITATWTAVASVAKIGDFSVMRETVETTTHDGDGFRDHIATLADLDEFDMTLLFDPDDVSHEYFRDQVADRLNANGETFRTKLSTSVGTETWEFQAIITKFVLSERDTEGRLEAVVTFRPNAKPDFDPA